MARATQRRALGHGLRRAAALAVGACLFVLVASAGAETAPGTAAADEPTAIGDAATVATGQFVSIAEGIGVDDGTGTVSGQSVTVGESVSVADATTTATGQFVAVGEGVGISDGTDTMTGQVVEVGEGVLVDDETDAQGLNVSPSVLVGQLSGDEGTAAIATGSFTDPDHGPWTAVADYGDGTPHSPSCSSRTRRSRSATSTTTTAPTSSP